MFLIRRARLAVAAALSVLALAPALVAADADFQSVRMGMMKDHSGKGGDPAQKFFHESTFHPHYDGRFTDKEIPEEKRRPHLVAMTRAYLSTMADLGAETWLMHGTLMGWWWNRKILPWDSDIDVQVTVDTLSFLYNFYQLYIFHFDMPKDSVFDADANPEDDGEGIGGRSKDYMLEINPDYYHETQHDDLNTIDARWIDMTTGMFIDITAVRPNETARALGQEGALKCKDYHKYNESDIFPLRDSTFEGVPAKIPYEYAWLLEEEYTVDSLTRTEFAKHRFNQTTMEWDPIPEENDGLPRGYRRPRPGPGSRRIG